MSARGVKTTARATFYRNQTPDQGSFLGLLLTREATSSEVLRINELNLVRHLNKLHFGNAKR